MSKIKNILVIKLGALGDFILTTGQMKAIRLHFPRAHITLMTGEKFLSIAQQSGYFNDYIIDNRTHKIQDYVRIAKLLSQGKFDLIIDLQGQKRTRQRYYALARLFSKKEFSWALPSQEGYHLRTIPNKWRGTWGTAKESTLTIKWIKPSLEFCHGENKNFHLLPKSYVLFIPGCSVGHNFKRWPAPFYAQLAKKLADKKIKTVVMGTSAEENEIKTICKATPFAVNFCNKSALLDIPDLAKKAMAVVGNDTGPTHIASLVNRPVVALFCHATKQAALPFENVHNIIGQNIDDITVEQVFQTLMKIIDN